MKQLAELRTNMSMAVNYDNGHLFPRLELILICVEPEYNVVCEPDGNAKFEKFTKVSDTRIFLEPQQIDEIIESLEATKNNMQVFSELGKLYSSHIKVKDKDAE